MVMPPIVTSSKRPRVNCRTSSGASKRFKTTSTVGPGEIISVLPNESRLSCGAKLKYSQLELYHTARRTFAGLIEEGRRQLQALVRLRTTGHSSGPSLAKNTRGTQRSSPQRRRHDAKWTARSELTTITAPRPPRDSHWKAPWIEPNLPDGSLPRHRGRPLVFTKN